MKNYLIRILGLMLFSCSLVGGPTLVGSKDNAKAVALQTDGKIVAAGYSIINNAPNFIVTRYTPTGVLDAAFGTFAPGITTTAIGSGAVANAVAVQTDGKIVVAGFAVFGGMNKFEVARYTTTGTLDGTFGIGGITVPVAIGSNASIAAILHSTRW